MKDLDHPLNNLQSKLCSVVAMMVWVRCLITFVVVLRICVHGLLSVDAAVVSLHWLRSSFGFIVVFFVHFTVSLDVGSISSGNLKSSASVVFVSVWIHVDCLNMGSWSMMKWKLLSLITLFPWFEQENFLLVTHLILRSLMMQFTCAMEKHTMFAQIWWHQQVYICPGTIPIL